MSEHTWESISETQRKMLRRLYWRSLFGSGEVPHGGAGCLKWISAGKSLVKKGFCTNFMTSCFGLTTDGEELIPKEIRAEVEENKKKRDAEEERKRNEIPL